MEYNIILKTNEWNNILNALQYFEEKNLKQSIETLAKANYQDISGLFVNEDFFKEYKKEQIKLLKSQIEQIEKICEKITNEVEEN